MNRVRLLAVLILIILALAITACAPRPTDCAREDIFCVGLVTAYDGVEDHGLNQIVWETLQNTKTQAKIARLDNIESIDVRDWQKNILFFADNSYDLIVTVGTSLGGEMVTVAGEYPGISFIGVDQEFDKDYKNIATITFPEDKAGFLAGMLAAMVSTADKVGAICETSGIITVWEYCEGFRAGAMYETDDIDVNIVYRDSGNPDKTFDDPEWGQQTMLSLVEEGVDTMTAFGGNTAQGAFLAASEKGVLVIGSEEDLYYRLPNVQEALVTSIINDPGMQLSSLVLTASQGNTILGPYAGQISYAPFRTPLLKSATEIQSNLENALQKIESGEIKIDIPEKE